MRQYHKVKHILRWWLIHTALILFFCDVVAAIWPSFDHVWTHVAHLGVAFAAFGEAAAEHLIREAEAEVK